MADIESIVKSTDEYGALGKAIIERAQEARSEDVQNAIVNGVKSILLDIASQKRGIQVAEAKIELQQARISALQSGEFKIDNITGTVVFNDKTLNIGSYL
jgi:hypothetical protein